MDAIIWNWKNFNKIFYALKEHNNLKCLANIICDYLLIFLKLMEVLFFVNKLQIGINSKVAIKKLDIQNSASLIIYLPYIKRK